MYKYPYGDSQQLNLDWIIAKLKELEAAGLGLNLEEVSNALISLTYNTNTAYRRYDYAFLNGKLYRCLSDTSGAFDPAAWQEALIGDDLAVLTRWINAIDAAAVVDVKFDTSGTNGKIQQKYHDQYHDVVEVDYTPVQNSKRPLSSNAGYELNGAITAHFPEDSITNLNDLPTGTIIGKFGNNTTNAPTTGSGTIWHYASSANSACQFVQSNGFLGIFARYRASGIWADWVRLDDISPNFVNELSVTIDNIEIAAENNADIDTSYEPYTSYTPTKAGYKAIAITGWTLTSASSGGTNPNNCTVFTYRMNSAGQLYFRIKNNATTAAKIRLRVYILWVKSST